jgi:hypothetical protein
VSPEVPVVLLPQFRSPHKSLGTWSAFLLALVSACFPAVAQQRDACNPSPSVKAALDGLPKQTPDDTDWEFHEKTVVAIQELLRKYPGDFFVQRRYVDEMYRRADRAKTIEEYRGRLAASPDSIEFSHLYGLTLFGRQSPEAIKLFSAALEKDPKFPWPRLPLAWIYGSPVFRDKTRQKAQVVAFLDACPDVREGYEALSGVDDKALMRERAAQWRTRLAKRGDTEAVAGYRALWSLEFKAAPPSEYDALRKQAAADVQRIRELNLKSTEWYYTLVEGYKVADEQKRSEEVAEEQQRVSPDPILPTGYGTWFKEHPFPTNESDLAGKREYWAVLLEQSKKWTQERPNTAFLWDERLDALVELDAPALEIEAAADKALEVGKKNAGPDGPESYGWFNIARALSKKHLKPDRVLECTEKGLAQLEIEKKEPDYDLYATKDRVAERQLNLADQEARGGGYLVDANIELKQLDKAQIDLVRLDERLEDVQSLAGDKQDKKRAYLGLRSAYWGRMARLCELQNRKLDAMGFYENALLARLDAEEKPEAGHKDELADDAKKLWTTLGGTEAGWTMWYGRRADELARSNSLRWEEANEALPGFELTDLSGKIWNLEALKGKVTFLNFWASW